MWYILTIIRTLCIKLRLYYFLSQNNLRPQYKGNQVKDTRTRINAAIKAPELRIITDTGENLGILSLADAIKAAEERKLDLIEISPKANPPIAKIMDYGKYRYETGRKAREVKAKSHITETKSVQVKIGTGDHDQQLKAKKTAEWLAEGHRVKVDLFLWGRYKYMEAEFLKERLERFLKIIPADYKIADPMKKSPKGWTTTLERVAASKNKKPVIIPADVKPKAEKKSVPTEAKTKKKSLDDLIEAGLI